jgi:hypothetical protein
MSKQHEIVKKLSEKFQPGQVKQRTGSFNQNTGQADVYDYVEIDSVLERLHQVFGAAISCRVFSETEVKNNKGKDCVRVGVEISYYDEAGLRHTACGFGSSRGATDDPGSDGQSALSKAIKRAAKFWGVPVDGGLDDTDERTTEDAVVTSGPKPGLPPKPGSTPPKPGTPPTPGAAKGGTATPPKPPAPSKPASTEVAVVDKKVAAPTPTPTPAKPAATPTPKPSTPPPPVAKVDPDEEEDDIELGLPNENTLNEHAHDDTNCNDCGVVIAEDVASDGATLTVPEIVEASLEYYAVPLCAPCVRARRASGDDGKE